MSVHVSAVIWLSKIQYWFLNVYMQILVVPVQFRKCAKYKCTAHHCELIRKYFFCPVCMMVFPRGRLMVHCWWIIKIICCLCPTSFAEMMLENVQTLGLTFCFPSNSVISVERLTDWKPLLKLWIGSRLVQHLVHDKFLFDWKEWYMNISHYWMLDQPLMRILYLKTERM